MGSNWIGVESVRVRSSRLDGTGGHRGRSIIDTRVFLKHAVEVKRRRLVAKIVVDSDRNCVALIRLDGRNSN